MLEEKYLELDSRIGAARYVLKDTIKLIKSLSGSSLSVVPPEEKILEIILNIHEAVTILAWREKPPY